MTRVGWVMLALIVLIGAGFVSLTRFGSVPRSTRQHVLPMDGPAGALTVPVEGVARSSLRDNWGDPRAGGLRSHRGLDIVAPGGTTVVAATAGRVEKLFGSALGGTTLYLRSSDGQRIYYYAHLAGYAPGIVEGKAVKAGERLGFVGDTGDAGPGNYHLHFGVQRMRPGDRWWQGEDVDPYPLLARGASSR